MKNDLRSQVGQGGEGLLVKADEFRRILQVSPNTFKRMLDDGVLPKPLFLGGRVRRWSREAVYGFVNCS